MLSVRERLRKPDRPRYFPMVICLVSAGVWPADVATAAGEGSGSALRRLARADAMKPRPRALVAVYNAAAATSTLPWTTFW